MIEGPGIMNFRCFFHSLLVFLSFVYLDETEGKLLVNDNSWKNCVGKSFYPISITNFNNVPFEKTERVFEFNGTITTPVLATLEVSFCSLKDHPDACSQETVDKYLLTCSQIIAENQPWTDFFASFEPVLDCPLEPGVYRSNAPAIDVWKIHENSLKEVRPGIYQVHFSVIHRYGTLLCWDIEYEVKQPFGLQKLLSNIIKIY
ncbi:uncharacterized protein LOC123317948 [Coccinella septempunctata]|uniref:uncharacterized protein LOC123317948 n=1 Tax=Coccinella septempunctata TaxID=41139 RepID=UPI001D06C6A8|nr:uncharacterized protein LOC123317948 [Coccinella septempunctata]